MADTNIKWNGTPIDNIERDSLSLNRINENGTIREMVDTINANFLNIAKHGGGPAGINGADGSNGVDGSNAEYIYVLCDEMKPNVQYPTNIYERINLFNSVKSAGKYKYKGVTWFDNAQPISPDHKNEYVWTRIKRGTSLTEWYYASEPVMWAHWGEIGKDGNGIEYIFLASSNELTSLSLNASLLKIENMDDFQKVIFNIDDFYPGKKWFNSGNNKQKARLAISKKGLEISDSTFDTRWGQYFNFCSDTYSWTDEPTGTGPSVLYEYVSTRKSTTDKNDIKKWGNFSTPALWSNYNLPTKSAIIYCNLGEGTTPESPVGGWVNMSTGKLIINKPGYELTPNYWKDTNDDIEENQATWMSTGVFDHTGKNTYWSYPVRITGKDGKNGEDGTLIEFIYALTTPGKQPDYPNITNKEKLDKLFEDIEKSTTSPKHSTYGSTIWYDRAQAISADIPVEYMAQRSKKPDETEWVYTEPIIWSHWGEDGTDGDGVEYIFATTKMNSKDGLILPVYSSLNDSQKKIFQIDDFVPSEEWFNKPKSKQKVQEILGESFNNIEWSNHYGFNVSSKWSDNPVEVSPSVQYQWVSIRRSHADEHTGDRFWEDFSTPVLWNNYGKISMTFIVYCNMSDETTPKSPVAGWWNTSNNTLQMSKTNASEYKSNALSSGTPDYLSYVGYWSDNNIDVNGTITWISTGEFNDSIDENGSNNISWSKPFRITGETGEPGADGSNMQFVYALCDDKDSLKYPQNGSITDKNNFFDSVENAGTNGYEYSGTTWYDHPQGVKNEKGKRTEWVWSRSKPAGDSETTQWETSPSAVIWSHWGEDGTDGDGVEYMFLASNSETYNTPTESNWNKVFDNFIGSTSDTVKYTYAMSDFLPTVVWLNTNKTAVQAKMQEDGKTFSESDWVGINTTISNANLGDLWKDNPGNINSSYKYQFVSIRKMNNGEWGPFSYPKLWSKYATIKFKSIVFTATTIDTDLSGCTVTGGNFSTPIPTLTKNGDQTIDVTWTDGPEPDVSTGKTQIWMTSANVTEGDESALVWSAPQKMTDTTDFQIEWSSTDKTLVELASINQSLTQSKYNFGTFLKANNYSENVAELAWRTTMSDDFNILFGDNSENAILMATCQLKNGVWSDWKITRVKGEKGDNGTSVNIKDRIIYESYLTSGTEYNYTNANNRRGTYTPDKTPENGDLLIVYPAELNESGIYYGDTSDGGKLYMWKYTNEWIDYNDPNSIGEETGNTYVSPNGHLILWDGDSWQDLGNIVGPEGKSYTIAVKYAKDGENGDKEVITNELEIPNAKWIGICVYEEGTTIPDIKDSSWKWSLFKGQDGYGYEYIYKPTSTKDSVSIPQVPQMPSGGNWHTTPNIIPDGWTDEPIEPTETNKYVWMCWRKFDHSTQKWTDFMGVDNGTSATTNAKLWHFYVTDGEQGEAGNGYQYKYIRYDNSVNYGSTTCTVTNVSSDEPIFKIGEKIVSSTDSAQGADSGHTYEYRSERYGHTGSWSNWSNPVIIARYLDDSDIQATVQAEVSTATSGIEDSIKSSFQSTINDVNSLKEHIDPTTGVFSGTISDDTKTSLLSGYINTDNLTNEIKNVKLSGFDVDSNTNTARTFSEWIDYENNQYTTVNTKYDSLNGTLTTAVNDIKGKASSSALTEYQTKADAQFAKLENTVANGQYITDVDGYLLVEEDGTRRHAKDDKGNPTKNYTTVCESDKEKLIYVTTELASISQTVSDGIACTSIVTSTENGAAIFYQQVDDNGSKIYMDANTIGIHSDYFNLNNSGLKMKGNLLAKNGSDIITAGVIGNDTTGNDIKFFAGTSSTDLSDIENAPFRVYANGHLEATDATISGEITANKFSAEKSQSINYNDKLYPVTKSTTITGDTFEIGLSNVHFDLNDFSENKVYIKLVDELQDESGTISKEHKLYCVPVLCMKYCGKEYMLSPASWISSPLPAKMWWEKLYDAKQYKRINYTTQICYFNTNYGKCDMYYDKALIEKTDTGIYQLMYEVDNKEYESEVESLLSSTNPPLIDSNSKEGKYELGDRDTGYFVVNDSNCKTFASYLSNGEEYYGISSNIETKTDINNYGLQKARDFIKKILKDTGGDLPSSYSSVYGWYNGPSGSGSSTSVTFAQGDVKKLIPFLSDEEKTNYGGLETNSTIKVDIQYTPIKKLYNGDLTNKVEYIDFTIKYTINCTYASTGTITINDNQYNVSAGEFILKCNCLLKMTTPYDDDNHKPTNTDDAWMMYLPTCFNAIDFSTISVSMQKEHGVFNFTGEVQISGGTNNYIHIEKKPLTS